MIEASPIPLKQVDEIRLTLIEAARSMDEITHNVRNWAGYLAFLLEDVEFLAMANDPGHPDMYEIMLTNLRDMIEARLKDGSWPARPIVI